MRSRIWELDVFRGLCVLGMIAVHFVYDMTSLYHLVDWQLPQAFIFVQNWGGVLFLLLSGICITLGHRPVRRGLVVLAAGLLVSLVTFVMWKFFSFGQGILICFGVLHCLGVCMLLWPLFRRLHWSLLFLLGAGLMAAGFWVDTLSVSFPWLIPLGIAPEGFLSSDYFPLLPNLGFFLMGAGLGRTLYKTQRTLFPKADPQFPVFRFLSLCGRNSLWIYLLHQPILSGLVFLLSLL